MRRHPEAFRLTPLAGLLLIGLTAACGPNHHLAEYSFTDRRLAVVFLEPPAPELLTGLYDLRLGRDPVLTAIRIGGGVAKEIEARRVGARLDSAVRQVDLTDRLAQRTLERASRYLGTEPVTNERDADFVLEVNLRHFGIDARSNEAAYLYTRAEAVLLDRRTGREIWNVSVRGSDRMTPWVHGNVIVPSSIITAAGMSTISVADLQEALDQLTISSSRAITNVLRDKLRDVRNY